MRNLAELLESHPHRFEINAARQAIRAIDCTGEIVAHIPLTTSQLAAATQ